nr:immunoglobulin light chain junction region [Macaca mulatta]
CVEYTISPFTF